MPSTSLEMYQNRFRPGLRPGPHWGSLQRSLRPLAGGEGARRVLSKNPTPSSALRASAIHAMLCRPPTPPKINPSYGLASAVVELLGRPTAFSCVCHCVCLRSKRTTRYTIADGPHDALCHTLILVNCCTTVGTGCTTNPEQVGVKE